MRQVDVEKMLHKVDEVKALFEFGERVIPYLEELVLFVQETAPMLEEMNTSIEESTQKMPFAVEKLDRVTETTESVTTSMLDLIDQILTNLDRIMDDMTDVEESVNQRLAQENGLILKLARTLDGDDETKAADVETELKNLIKIETKKAVFNSLNERLSVMQGDVFEIMNALQIQDITSQQIMSANSLIEAVQEKLGHLLGKFSDMDIEEISKAKIRVFDPNASYEDKTEVQAAADEIYAEHAQNTQKITVIPDQSAEKPSPEDGGPGETVDQEEIDKLVKYIKS
ncbi:MAG: hypothetical protein DWQ05_13955 [Calditrichaeota bacterium]|nr:MAG: hypothetical protein DWQ05_13955 [Calditrichota bacterium]